MLYHMIMLFITIIIVYKIVISDYLCYLCYLHNDDDDNEKHDDQDEDFGLMGRPGINLSIINWNYTKPPWKRRTSEPLANVEWT